MGLQAQGSSARRSTRPRGWFAEVLNKTPRPDSEAARPSRTRSAVPIHSTSARHRAPPGPGRYADCALWTLRRYKKFHTSRKHPRHLINPRGCLQTCRQPGCQPAAQARVIPADCVVEQRRRYRGQACTSAHKTATHPFQKSCCRVFERTEPHFLSDRPTDRGCGDVRRRRTSAISTILACTSCRT